MIETGAMMGAEESGGFGFGMHLPERDGIYADLLLLDLFLREQAAGRWPVSTAIAHFHELAGPSFYQRIDVHVERAAVRRDEAPPAGRARAAGADRPRRRAGRADHDARHRTTASSSSSRTGRGCWSGRRARSRSSASTPRRRRPTCATRCSWPASGWCAARDGDSPSRCPPRRQAVGPRADLGPHRPLRRQDPRHRGRQAAVAPAPRDQGRVDLRAVRAGCGCTLEDDAAWSASRSWGPASTAACRPGGSTATRRSSAASSSRCRRPSSTTSSGSRTTSAAKGPAPRRPVRGVTGGRSAGVL